MKLNYSEIKKLIVNTTVPAPLSGTLAGHAAGEPFEKNVLKKVKELYPSNTYKPFEYLNKLFKDNPNCTTYEERISLLGSELIQYLIKRGKEQTKKWAVDNLFVEKQDDTADILYIDDDFFEFIDVKTRNMNIKGQAPNIISSFKLAQAMKLMIDSGEYDKLDFVYIGIDWEKQGAVLVATDVHVVSLFKTDPKKLYINWAAARQIQFHVSDLSQDYKGTKEQWAKEYLKYYYKQALNGAEKMKTKFADPFADYVND